MVNTIFILDKNKRTSEILTVDRHSRHIFWDDTYSLDLSTGAESFEFTCFSNEKIIEGANVIFYYNDKYKMFTIIEVEEEHENGKLVTTCYCEISSMELLNKHKRPFELIENNNCINFFRTVLEGTGWYIGRYSSSLEGKCEEVKVTKSTPIWSLIEDYKDVYECEIDCYVTYENGRITGQYVDIYDNGEMGSPIYKRFEYGKNVTGIVRSIDISDWCTGVIVDVSTDTSDDGENSVLNAEFSKADGYPFDKPKNSDVILDEQANIKYNGGRDYVMGVYTGKETNAKDACINAYKYLQSCIEPRFDYEVTTALTSDEYEDIHLGDTVYVIDHTYKPELLLEARVGKLELSFSDRTKNKCVLSNYKEIKSKLLSAEYIKLTGTITDVVNAFFPLGPNGIKDGAILADKINTTVYDQIHADIMSASTGVFEELYAEKSYIIDGKIENLESTYAKIVDLEAERARIDTLDANKANITELNVEKGRINELESGVANINSLLAGNASLGTGHIIRLTADNATIDDAFIKDAMIDTVSANKITAGTINTEFIDISNEDGSLVMNSERIQFNDIDEEGNATTRIQIGKDASGDFTFTLYDETGEGVLIDSEGIKPSAIGDGLIVDDMVANDAGIQGSKLNIKSVITSINDDGSTSINSTKIYLDDENPTLDVAFSTLKTTVTEASEKVEGYDTRITATEEGIETLTRNTTIEEDGETVLLKDSYSQFTQDLGGFKTSVSEMITSASDNASKQIIDSQEDILDKINEDYATKTDLNLMQETFNSSFEQTAESIDMVFSQSKAGIEEVDGRLNQYQQQVSQYIRFDAEGMELGEAGSNFTTRLDNERLSFKDGETEVAYISNKKMMITDANINVSLGIGGFRFIPRPNGNMSLIWDEGTNAATINEEDDL